MTRIKNPSLTWSETGIPASDTFDDVYYNRHNGLDEACEVFLHGNNLPESWQNQQNFVIAETGFGTGLNFLASWKLFEETTRNDERLDFISVEQFPMHADDLAKSLQRWQELIGAKRIERLLAAYPPRIPGFHRRWITDRVTLTLIFDEAQRGINQLDTPVDAWFLDGFSPAKNPSMWQPDLFQAMAHLSHAKTTLASFTAAGFVRRSLQDAGFTIERRPGYKYKAHRIIGSFAGIKEKPVVQKPSSVTIIGCGLAGSAASYALERRGIRTTLIDRMDGVAKGASGNRLGLINPKIEAQDNPRNEAGMAAFSFAGHLLEDLPGIEYRKTGTLHLAMDEAKKKRLEKIYAHSNWLPPHQLWLSAAEIQAHTGLNSVGEGLFYPEGGMVNTAKLVQAMLKDRRILFNHSVDEDDLPEEPVILACGWGLKAFSRLAQLPIEAVRGQVTYAEIPDLSLKFPVMVGNYIAPAGTNLFSLGASFEKNNESTALKISDDADNIRAVNRIMGVDMAVNVVGHWANIRTASRDRFPIVGKVPLSKNLYVSGALGSHGIQFSLLHAEILACLLSGAPLPLGKDALQCLSINRFYR